MLCNNAHLQVIDRMYSSAFSLIEVTVMVRLNQKVQWKVEIWQSSMYLDLGLSHHFYWRWMTSRYFYWLGVASQLSQDEFKLVNVCSAADPNLQENGQRSSQSSLESALHLTQMT